VLVDCVSTGYMTVAMASCPAAGVQAVLHPARRGPACKGWHSLPHCPETFARSGMLACRVRSSTRVGEGSAFGVTEVALRTALSHLLNNIMRCYAQEGALGVAERSAGRPAEGQTSAQRCSCRDIRGHVQADESQGEHTANKEGLCAASCLGARDAQSRGERLNEWRTGTR